MSTGIWQLAAGQFHDKFRRCWLNSPFNVLAEGRGEAAAPGSSMVEHSAAKVRVQAHLSCRFMTPQSSG